MPPHPHNPVAAIAGAGAGTAASASAHGDIRQGTVTVTTGRDTNLTGPLVIVNPPGGPPAGLHAQIHLTNGPHLPASAIPYPGGFAIIAHNTPPTPSTIYTFTYQIEG